MSDDTRQALPDDGKGNKGKELLFFFVTEYGLGYPEGYRPRRIVCFARWRQYLWEMDIHTVSYHAVDVKHGINHPKCGPGTIIVCSEKDPHTELMREIIKAHERADEVAERALMSMVVTPIEARKGCVLVIVVDRQELAWEDVERTALGLVHWEHGNPTRVRCIWRNRIAAAERAEWEEEYKAYLASLLEGPREHDESLKLSDVERRAKSSNMTLRDMRRRLRESGFEEDEHGNFTRKRPKFNEGDEDVILHALLAYAKTLGYDGPVYLSPHSWTVMSFVAGRKRFQTEFQGERAWYGYLAGAKQLVCISPQHQSDPSTYHVKKLPADPDFLKVMREVAPKASEEARASDGALKEKGWMYDRTPDGERSTQSGRSADEPPKDNEETQT